MTINNSIVDNFIKDRVLVYLKKNKDYGDSFLNSLTKYGKISAYVRMEDKVNRYTQLKQAKNKTEVVESLEDTILDLFNYVCMYKTFANDGAYINIKYLVEVMYYITLDIVYGKDVDIVNTGEFRNVLVYEMEISQYIADSIIEDIRNYINISTLQEEEKAI